MHSAFRNRVALGLYWLTLGYAQAVAKPPDAELEVTVHIYNEARISSRLLKKAESEAARLFREGRISIRWVVCPLSAIEHSRNLECDEVPSSPLFFLKRLEASLHPVARKWTHPREIWCTIVTRDSEDRSF